MDKVAAIPFFFLNRFVFDVGFMNCSDCCCRHNLANRHVGWQEEVYVPVPGPDVEHYRQLLRHGISTIVNKLPAMRAGNSIGY